MMDRIADQAVLIVEHALPDRDPAIRFRQVIGGDGPLEEQFAGDPNEVTRTFEVLTAGQGFGGWGEYMGSLARGSFGMVVELRYAEPNHRLADRMMSADEVRLAHELDVEATLPVANCGWGPELNPTVTYLGSEKLRIPPHFYLFRLRFSVDLHVEKNQ
jgi:hypothetical protein